MARHGPPEIFDTDQGSQFTSTDVIKVLAVREVKISMEGKGGWRDKVFVERLWRTIKYQEVHLRADASASEARAGIGRYPAFNNARRPPSSLDGKTPRSGQLQPADTRARGGVTKAENHLRNAWKPVRPAELPSGAGCPGGAIGFGGFSLLRCVSATPGICACVPPLCFHGCAIAIGPTKWRISSY